MDESSTKAIAFLRALGWVKRRSCINTNVTWHPRESADGMSLEQALKLVNYRPQINKKSSQPGTTDEEIIVALTKAAVLIEGARSRVRSASKDAERLTDALRLLEATQAAAQRRQSK